MNDRTRQSDTSRRAAPGDARVHAANRAGDMGPAEKGGGYGSQRFDTDRHGGSYGTNTSSGGSYTGQHGLDGADPLAERPILMGMQHMAGRHGDQAYGRIDAPSGTRIPVDPSQRNFGDLGSSAERPGGESQNAQISGGSPTPPVGQGTENERNSPGISTDKASDDTKS